MVHDRRTDLLAVSHFVSVSLSAMSSHAEDIALSSNRIQQETRCWFLKT